MKIKLIITVISLVTVLSIVLASCAGTTPSNSTPQAASQPSTSASIPPPPTTSASSATATQTPVTTSNWWDKFGTPQYGGTLNIWTSFASFPDVDPQDPRTMAPSFSYEPLFGVKWTTNPSVEPMVGEFLSPEFYQGDLAESWEQTDPTTITVHLRQGIHWWNKPPVNGREFTSADVVFNYDRLLGTGSGFTKGISWYDGVFYNIDRVVATDKYTVQFKLKDPSTFLIYQVIPGAPNGNLGLFAPEMVNTLGDANKWSDIVGTGPFMMTNYVSGSSLTYQKNTDYWGYDERYTQNKLPYFDALDFMVIPDINTAVAALRTGKLDLVQDQRSCLTKQQVESLQQTNPDIHIGYWPAEGYAVDMRVDKAPFTDIRVRQALEMSIDRPTIAKTFWNNVDGTPCGLVNPINKNFCTPYDQWPADLQADYSYNPTQAKKLLADAGYPNGFKTTCVMSTSDSSELMQAIAGYFQNIGVDVTIQAMSNATMMPYCMSGKSEGLDLFVSCGLIMGGPLNSINFRTQNENRNFTHNVDPKYADMYQQIANASTLTDAETLIKQADMYSLQQFWAVNLFSGNVPIAWSPSLKGYSGQKIFGPVPDLYARLWKTK